MGGLGIDARVLERLNKQTKRRIGMLAYLPAIGRALTRANAMAVEVDFDGHSWRGDALQIVVSNTRRYASVTSMAPDAVVDDGKLDMTLIPAGGPVADFRQLASLLLHQHPSDAIAVTERIAQVRVRAREKVPLQTDGGRVKQKQLVKNHKPVDYLFEVVPAALDVLVPRDYTGTLFSREVE